MQKKFANKIVTHFREDDAPLRIYNHLIHLLANQPEIRTRPVIMWFYVNGWGKSIK